MRIVWSSSRTDSAADARTKRALVGMLVFYVAVLFAMVASNHYVFILKSLVVPVLLLAALLLGRFKRFVNDWAVFLGAIVFFDFCRGLAFALICHFELPMHLGYVIDWERWLCGGAIAPLSLQHLRAGLSDPVWLDRFFVLVHSSHFLFFLLFGFVIWYARPEAFRTYVIATAAVMYAGLVFFFLIPTIPPWAAANQFMVLPPLMKIRQSFYDVRVPQLVAAFDVNPIAAMPSLHAALPAMCALFALRCLGPAGVFVVVYALTVCVAVIYLGEHYLVDVVVGCLLALAVYAGVRGWEARSGNPAPPGTGALQDRWAVRPIAIALVLIAAAVGLGQLTARWRGPWPITRAFVERELMGRSQLAHFYLDRVASAGGDFTPVDAALTRGLDDPSRQGEPGQVPPEQAAPLRRFLGEVLQNGHTSLGR